MADTTTPNLGLLLIEVGASEDTWGAKVNENSSDIDSILFGSLGVQPDLVAGWKVGGVAVTATAAELNILDGLTASTTELNTLDGLTASTAELNILDGVTVTATEINYLTGLTVPVLTALGGKQDLDADLTAIAGLASSGLIARTGAGAAAARTLQAGAGVSITNGDGAAGDPTIAFAADGAAPVYACRAWVQFDGTPSTPVVAGSGNVASVVKTGTGRYVITFTTAMPDANYAVQVSSKDANSGSNGGPTQSVHAIAADSCEIRLGRGADNTLEDSSLVSVCVFR